MQGEVLSAPEMMPHVWKHRREGRSRGASFKLPVSLRERTGMDEPRGGFPGPQAQANRINRKSGACMTGRQL